MGLHNCDETQICINSIGSFTCDCHPGFELNFSKTKCVDQNECKSSTHSCNTTTSYCHNLLGSYSCECKLGFEKAGTVCESEYLNVNFPKLLKRYVYYRNKSMSFEQVCRKCRLSSESQHTRPSLSMSTGLHRKRPHFL